MRSGFFIFCAAVLIAPAVAFFSGVVSRSIRTGIVNDTIAFFLNVIYHNVFSRC